MKFFDKLFGKKQPADSGFLSGTHRELAESSIQANPDFTEAIRNLTENPSFVNREKAHNELLKLQIWLASAEDFGPRSEDGTTRASLECVMLKDGTPAAVAFTDPFAAKLFMGEHFILTNLGLPALVQAIAGTQVQDIVINHGGPVGIRLLSEELPYLVRGISPYSDEAVEQIKARQPEEHETLSAEHRGKLKAILAAEPEVLTARLSVFEMNSAVHCLFAVLKLTEGGEGIDAVKERLTEAAAGLPVFFTELDEEEEVGFEDSSVPLYARA